jgi:two-component system nitrogen regulation sensor histidine kinase GlnL
MNPLSPAKPPDPVEMLLTRPDEPTILANIPLPVLLVDQSGQVQYANDACETFLGKARRRIVGFKLSDSIAFEESRLNEALNAGSGALTAQNMRLAPPHRDTIVDINVSIFDGAQDGWRMLVISPRFGDRSYIHQKSGYGSEQSIGTAAILGHEIKNPLAGIRGAAQLLAKGSDGRQKSLTDLIVNEVDRIARLLDQMQNLGGKAALNPAPHNIHAILDQAIGTIRAANKDLPELLLNFDPSLPDLLIDSDAMLQIIINLIQNAIEALASQEDRRIEISTRFVMSGALKESLDVQYAGQYAGRTTKLPVEIRIADNGPGISDSIAGEIFSPFVTTKRDGQGLGLAIVHKLIKQMHGRIQFECRSEPTRRTQFLLYLPMAEGGGHK